MSEREAERILRTLPGVGPSMARDLLDLGIRSLGQLSLADPETLYKRLCALRGAHVDRCVLYVFRCAVHNAPGLDPDPQKRLWWRFKDQG